MSALPPGRGAAGRRDRSVPFDVPPVGLTPRVKICGCRTPADAVAAAEAGADYVGLVFAESPRRVTRREAAAIVREVSGRLRPVGVFVDEAADRVLAVAEETGVRVAQLHGSEPPADCAALRAAGLEVWKALRPRAREELAAALRLYAENADGFLVEGRSENAAGGTGTPFPHEWLEGAWPGGAREAGPPGAWRRPEASLLILAGGLTPETVAEAVRRVRPDVVDVSSGVERRPGEKDPHLVRRFVEGARGALEARA